MQLIHPISHSACAHNRALASCRRMPQPASPRPACRRCLLPAAMALAARPNAHAAGLLRTCRRDQVLACSSRAAVYRKTLSGPCTAAVDHNFGRLNSTSGYRRHCARRRNVRGRHPGRASRSRHLHRSQAPQRLPGACRRFSPSTEQAERRDAAVWWPSATSAPAPSAAAAACAPHSTPCPCCLQVYVVGTAHVSRAVRAVLADRPAGAGLECMHECLRLQHPTPLNTPAAASLRPFLAPCPHSLNRNRLACAAGGARGGRPDPARAAGGGGAGAG